MVFSIEAVREVNGRGGMRMGFVEEESVQLSAKDLEREAVLTNL